MNIEQVKELRDIANSPTVINLCDMVLENDYKTKLLTKRIRQLENRYLQKLDLDQGHD